MGQQLSSRSLLPFLYFGQTMAIYILSGIIDYIIKVFVMSNIDRMRAVL